MPDKNLPTEWVQPMSEADRDWIERKMYPTRPKPEGFALDMALEQIKEMNRRYDFSDDPGMTGNGTIKKWKSRKV